MASTIRNVNIEWGMSVFPVAIRKASEKADVKFDRAVKMVTPADGGEIITYERIERRDRVADDPVHVVTRGKAAPAAPVLREVAPNEIVHGVWVSEDEFVPLPEGALAEVAEATKLEEVVIEEFIPLRAVPWERVEGAYYLCPQKGLIGAKPLRLLRDAMKAEKAAACCKLSLKGETGRQRLGVIHEANGKVMVNLLAFAADFRDSDESADAIANVVVDRKAVAMARELVKAMTGTGDFIETAADDAVSERERLYEEAAAGRTPVPRTKVGPKAEPVGDLMAALEASLADAQKKAKRRPKVVA